MCIHVAIGELPGPLDCMHAEQRVQLDCRTYRAPDTWYWPFGSRILAGAQPASYCGIGRLDRSKCQAWSISWTKDRPRLWHRMKLARGAEGSDSLEEAVRGGVKGDPPPGQVVEGILVPDAAVSVQHPVPLLQP